MTEDNKLSRRQSLKGIAATGAIIGGIGLGTNSASAFQSGSKVAYSDYDPCKEKAELYVFNNHRETKKYKYKVKQTGEEGRLTVESDGKTEYGYFWVKAPKDKLTVKLYEKGKYGYEHVDSVVCKPDKSKKCKDHDGKDDKKDYDGKDDKKDHDGKDDKKDDKKDYDKKDDKKK